MKALNVSEAAQQIGCSGRWLRDAEKAGKIPKARRNLNNWRVYTDEDISRIRELLVPNRK